MATGDDRWQDRMAPLMAGAVVVTAVFFAVVLLARVGSIEATLRAPPPATVAVPWTTAALAPTTWHDQAALASAQAAFVLEREVIARRYGQAAAVQSLRLWTRLMGFLTGMILAMVGAAFVLGKLTSPESEIAGGASGASVSIRSASPGVVLAVLGTILIGISLIVPATADVHDGAIYFAPSTLSSDAPDPSMDAIEASPVTVAPSAASAGGAKQGGKP